MKYINIVTSVTGEKCTAVKCTDIQNVVGGILTDISFKFSTLNVINGLMQMSDN